MSRVGELSPCAIARTQAAATLSGYFFADLAFLLGSFLFAGSLRLGTPLATNAHRQAMLFVPLFAVLALYNRSCSVRTLTDRGYFAGLLLASDFGGIHLVLYLLSQGIGPVFAVHLDVGNIAVVRADDPVPFVDLPLNWQALGVASQNILVIENDGPAVDIAHAYRVIARSGFLQLDGTDSGALDLFGRCIANMESHRQPALLTLPRCLWRIDNVRA
ncbi:MAG: hypothetical protein CL819_13520 [Croceicoccus sp.]|nr:hypothetical protein [Croceicoccus sp.]